MVEQGGGAIVNVALGQRVLPARRRRRSTTARPRRPCVNLSKSLAQEFGPTGIRVNCVSPGPVGTDLWLGEHGVAETSRQATGADADTARAQVVAGIGGSPPAASRRPRRSPTLVVLLASTAHGNVTGSNYVIDGGLVKNI